METKYVCKLEICVKCSFAEPRIQCHYSVPVKLNCVSSTLIGVLYRNTDSCLAVGEWLSYAATGTWSASKLKTFI